MILLRRQQGLLTIGDAPTRRKQTHILAPGRAHLRKSPAGTLIRWAGFMPIVTRRDPREFILVAPYCFGCVLQRV